MERDFLLGSNRMRLLRPCSLTFPLWPRLPPLSSHLRTRSPPPPSGLVRPPMLTRLSCILLPLNDQPPRLLLGNQRPIGPPLGGTPLRIIRHRVHTRDGPLNHPLKVVSPSLLAAIFAVIIVIIVETLTAAATVTLMVAHLTDVVILAGVFKMTHKGDDLVNHRCGRRQQPIPAAPAPPLLLLLPSLVLAARLLTRSSQLSPLDLDRKVLSFHLASSLMPFEEDKEPPPSPLPSSLLLLSLLLLLSSLLSSSSSSLLLLLLLSSLSLLLSLSLSLLGAALENFEINKFH
jgi:hypothetical protein